MLAITSFCLWLEKTRLVPQPLGLSAARLGGVRRDLGRIRQSGWLSNEGGVGRKEEVDQASRQDKLPALDLQVGCGGAGSGETATHTHCYSVFMASVTAVAGEEGGRLTAHNKTPARWKGNLNSTSRYMHRPRPAKGSQHSTNQGPAAAHINIALSPGGRLHSTLLTPVLFSTKEPAVASPRASYYTSLLGALGQVVPTVDARTARVAGCGRVAAIVVEEMSRRARGPPCRLLNCYLSPSLSVPERFNCCWSAFVSRLYPQSLVGRRRAGRLVRHNIKGRTDGPLSPFASLSFLPPDKVGVFSSSGSKTRDHK